MVAGRYTLLDHTAADDLFPLARERGVGIVNAGIFNSGLLARPRPGADAPYSYRPAPPEVLDRTLRIARVCEEFGVELPTAAVAFARRHPAVTSVVVGLRTPAEVHDLLGRSAQPVPDELWVALEADGIVAGR